MGDIKLDEIHPEEVRLAIPHERQIHNWDCGLACSKMVLKKFSKNISDFSSFCKSLKFGDSVWTIDLAQIMNHYNIDNHLTTITFGVDKGYSKKSFYKDRFSADELRVTELFDNAESLGIKAEKRSVPTIEIIKHLSKKKVIIALVDWSYLSCKWCDRATKCVNVNCMGKCMNIYQGHFVVVCGYNKKEKVIYYKNPSYREEMCCCSIKSFDLARKSYGTDEDLLFIDSECQDFPAQPNHVLANSEL